ncbi:hypothetical protein RBWH47_00237 [Rhodopirellula baltica WH47]|uniref:Uncharacterized protein n=1 Tax=Rhodopirellula baltica WH47 TaxID=991778 RepID=F2AT16_RHOBT|nr:hypothetical protein RBWH47_00237 [Rhodopirellula baltica WH47]
MARCDRLRPSSWTNPRNLRWNSCSLLWSTSYDKQRFRLLSNVVEDPK